MKRFQTIDKSLLSRAGSGFGAGCVPGLLLLMALALGRTASAQVLPEGDRGGLNIFAGATASGFSLQYGDRKMLGIAPFVDIDTRRAIGFEGEARWLAFHQTDNVHVTTWLAGPRYHRSIGKYQVYGKGLVGIGEFNFPYNYAYGKYLVIAPGGGVDYSLTRRVRLRLIDGEYQYWPQFTFGPLSSYGISTGLRIRVF
jgi:hypothetical protein